MQELTRWIGLLIALAVGIFLANAFTDFWWDEPDYGHDETMLTPVLVDNGDGTITQTYAPTFGKSPVEKARNAKLKSQSRTVLIAVVVLAVLVGAARGS